MLVNIKILQMSCIKTEISFFMNLRFLFQSSKLQFNRMHKHFFQVSKYFFPSIIISSLTTVEQKMRTLKNILKLIKKYI